MNLRWAGLVAVVMGAVGCAADGGSSASPTTPDYGRFSYARAAPHVTLYWNCTRISSGLLRLEGVAVNRWEPIPPRFLEVSLVGVDAQGKVLSQTRGGPQGTDLVKNFPAPFRLDLKEQGGEVRLDLAYRYQYRDDSLDRLSRRMPTDVTGRVPDACGRGDRQPR